MHLFNSERNDKTIASATVTREEPTSTMNHDENGAKYDSNFRQERSSPTDSYDENGKYSSVSSKEICIKKVKYNTTTFDFFFQDLDEIKEFAKSFKLRRLSMGLTQTQVGQALNITEGPAYSQSAICRLIFLHFMILIRGNS